jgi:hypothetical protein
MAIVQISKIIHRIGSQVDLPQLDTGEIGFSTDTRRLFIGNDPILYPPDPNGTTQTEILTEQSSVDFARLNGSEGVSMMLESPEEGQLLGFGLSDSTVTLTNLGGNATTTSSITRPKINLGDISNVTILGNAFNGAVLQTDGSGNLSWTTNGLFKVDIQTISKANPAVVTTKSPHYFGTGSSVNIYGFSGMTELLSDGDPAGSGRFWVERLSETTFSLYENQNRTSPINSSTYEDYVANTGYAWGGLPVTGNTAVAGADKQVQFNDGGVFGAVSNFTFNKSTNNVTIAGNLIVNTGKVFASTQGEHNGKVGATTPNTGAFTSITASTTITATGNITANNVTAVSNGNGTNFKVGDDAYIGDVNVSDTIQIKGVANSANAYIIFGDTNTSKLGRAGSGPLTYSGDMTITGNLTANHVAINSWSMFANVNGLFATDGANTYSINMTQI